jgi:hypothetical protein
MLLKFHAAKWITYGKTGEMDTCHHEKKTVPVCFSNVNRAAPWPFKPLSEQKSLKQMPQLADKNRTSDFSHR